MSCWFCGLSSFFLVVKLVRVAVECFDELLGSVNGVVGSWL